MSSASQAITIIVPTLNEEGNIAPLVKRIDATMREANLDYTTLFVDDHSTDNTVREVSRLKSVFPLNNFQLKSGKRGKAQSIIQGMRTATTEFICMIDADLQYPPEDIPKMMKKLMNTKADVALSTRLEAKTSALRRIMTSTFHVMFIRLLYGMDYDTQSGLKVFRRNVTENMNLRPSPWGFDLEFIVHCLTRGKRIVTHDIQFGERTSGEAKVDILSSSFELAKSSIALRLRTPGKKVRKAYNDNVVFNRKIAGAV